MIRELVEGIAVADLLLTSGVCVLLSSALGFWMGRRRDRPVLGVFLGGLLNLPGLVALVFVRPKEPEFY